MDLDKVIRILEDSFLGTVVREEAEDSGLRVSFIPEVNMSVSKRDLDSCSRIDEEGLAEILLRKANKGFFEGFKMKVVEGQ